MQSCINSRIYLFFLSQGQTVLLHLPGYSRLINMQYICHGPCRTAPGCRHLEHFPLHFGHSLVPWGHTAYSDDSLAFFHLDLTDKIFRPQVIAFGQYNQCFHGIFQFPNIAGPVLDHEKTAECRCQYFMLLIFCIERMEKLRCQRYDVLPPFPQRRNVDMDDVEPVIQITPEPSLLHHVPQIPVRSGNKTDINVDRPGSANSLYFLILYDPQQFGLSCQTQFPYFIEQEYALIGQFKKAGLTLPPGSGKGTAFITEQFRFKKLIGDGTAVNFQERFIPDSPVISTVESTSETTSMRCMTFCIA